MDLTSAGVFARSKAVALALVALPLASCASNAGSLAAGPSLASASAPRQVSPAGAGTVPVSISINRTQNAGERSLMYVSPSTASLSVSVASANAATTTSTANCTTTCSVQLLAPIGTDTFTVQLFDGSNGGGHLLSTGNTQSAIKAGVTNSVSLQLSGVIASVVVSASKPIVVGQAGTYPVSIAAKDAGGNTISGTYSQPIALSVSDTSNATTLSATSVPDSSTQVTVSYSGALAFTGGSINASVGGVASSAITPAQMTTASVVPITIQVQ